MRQRSQKSIKGGNVRNYWLDRLGVIVYNDEVGMYYIYRNIGGLLSPQYEYLTNDVRWVESAPGDVLYYITFEEAVEIYRLWMQIKTDAAHWVQIP